jgi:hypothetical protein
MTASRSQQRSWGREKSLTDIEGEEEEEEITLAENVWESVTELKKYIYGNKQFFWHK